jgi:hypothetical protein
MIKEFERAVLLVDLPNNHLKAGDVGIVVDISSNQRVYEIEFFTADGQTLDVVTVEAHQVRPVQHTDMLHVRVLSA